MRVLLTGANGFVGQAVLERASREDDIQMRAAVRRAQPHLPQGVEHVVAGDLAQDSDWTDALRGIDVVVHAAARVHMMDASERDSFAQFRRVNVVGTMQLARQAAAVGVRRFVYVSSIKVNGEETRPGRPFSPDDPPAPLDAYGVSKAEAEHELRALAAESGMEVVIIRPVLVYGPGVKANLLSMMRYLDRGLPLPFGAIHNRRSLVARDNLADLILLTVRHPAAANEIFLVSDNEDVSTPDLLRKTATALGTTARLIPVPSTFLRAAARLVGRDDMMRRLCGSLQVDISKTRERLGWVPPVHMDEALKRMADAFRRNAG